MHIENVILATFWDPQNLVSWVKSNVILRADINFFANGIFNTQNTITIWSKETHKCPQVMASKVSCKIANYLDKIQS